jgi:hypothetical protein
MAKPSATPALTPTQQLAVDALTSHSIKIPRQEAIDLVSRMQGTDAGEMISNAIRARAGLGPRTTPVPPPQGARLQSVGGVPAPPPMQGPPPPTPPTPPAAQPPQQIPGLGPPGGPGAAWNAQQLAAQFLPRVPRQPRPVSPSFGGPPGGGMPPPAPVGPRPPPIPPGPQGGPPGPQMTPPAVPPAPAAVSQIPPAPIKPRIRVRTVGTQIPEAATPSEVAQAKEQALGTAETQPEAPKPLEVPPMIKTHEEYEKLPSGARFLWPDGHRYRKP